MISWIKNIFKKDQSYVRLSDEERESIIEKSCKQVSRGVDRKSVV